jgi:hypothetical protein
MTYRFWKLYGETKFFAHGSRPADEGLRLVRSMKGGVDFCGGKSRSVARQSTATGGKVVGYASGNGPACCADILLAWALPNAIRGTTGSRNSRGVPDLARSESVDVTVGAMLRSALGESGRRPPRRSGSFPVSLPGVSELQNSRCAAPSNSRAARQAKKNVAANDRYFARRGGDSNHNPLGSVSV